MASLHTNIKLEVWFSYLQKIECHSVSFREIFKIPFLFSPIKKTLKIRLAKIARNIISMFENQFIILLLVVAIYFVLFLNVYLTKTGYCWLLKNKTSHTVSQEGSAVLFRNQN